MTLILAGLAIIGCSSGRSVAGAAPMGAVRNPAAAGHRTWIVTRSALDVVLTSRAARQELSKDRIFEILRGDERPTTALRVIPTESFASYALMAVALQDHKIPRRIEALIYDSETWALTPADEQLDPGTYYAKAAALAHRHGLTFIAAPGLDLVTAGRTAVTGRRAARYLALGLASAAGRDADVLDVQSQSLERNAPLYAEFVSGAATQARHANGRLVVVAGISSNPPGPPVTGAELIRAIAATSSTAEGYWLNVPQRGPQCPRCNRPDPTSAIAAVVGSTAGSS